MKTRHVLAPLVVATLIAACGGGGGTPDSAANASPGANQGRVSVLIGDDVTQNYAEVWVTVQKVATKDAADKLVVLFDDPIGKVVNLSTLPNIATLLSTSTLSAGTYHDVVITVANAVQLVNSTGAVKNATFAATGTTYDIAVDGDITVTAGATATVALDFDLKQFNLNVATNIVTPVVLYNDSADGLKGTYAEVEGRVQNVGSPTQFTLLAEHSATPITVTLANAATLYRDDTRQALADASTLRAGDNVEISGDYNSATLTVTANRVALQGANDSDGHNHGNGLSEVAGTVQSYDGGTLVLDVRKADFVPPTGTLTVANVSNAAFREGTLLTLQNAGQWIEIDGTWDGTTFTAQYVNLDDESSDTESGSDVGANSGREPEAADRS